MFRLKMVSKSREVVEANSAPEEGALEGLRMTKQRKVVYDVLLGERDHPTATEVFIRAKEDMPGISLATVYNCLETLSAAGLVKQVNVDREASRYCPNLKPHAHFVCSHCGEVFDIGLKREDDVESVWTLPDGAVVQHFDVTMKGVCAGCAGDAKEISEEKE